MGSRLSGQVLVIDNYNSFTFNLVQYLRELGARVSVKRNDALPVADIARADPAAIVMSPGPKSPRRPVSVSTSSASSGSSMPMLGVCLGHQAIGVAYGATVIRAPAVSTARSVPCTTLARACFAVSTTLSWQPATTPWLSPHMGFPVARGDRVER